jgi:hypothetical protein
LTYAQNPQLATTVGLSGDFGWGDHEDGPAIGPIGAAVVLGAWALHCTSLWVLGGLAPLPFLTTRPRLPSHRTDVLP